MKLNTKSLVDVEIGMPIFAEGNYHAKVDAAKVEPNKAKDGNNLTVTIVLLDPVLLRKDGTEVENKGRYKLTRRISLKPTDNYDPNTMLKELAIAIGHPVEEDLTVEDIVGKTCMVQLVVRPAEGQYAESNDIRRFTKQPADDTFEASALGG
jgi:hypothetical protein